MAPPRRTIMCQRQREAAKKRREEAEGPRLQQQPATSTERSRKRRELARLRANQEFPTDNAMNMSTSEEKPVFAFIQVKDDYDEDTADAVDGLASDHNGGDDDEPNYDYVDIDPMSVVKSEIAISDTEDPQDDSQAQNFDKEWVPRVDLVREGGKHQCPYCPYEAKPHILRSHIRKHTNTKEFKCHFCSFNTNYDTALRRHLKSLHPIGDRVEEKKVKKKKVYVKRFRCTLCPYVTAHRHGLKSHIRGIHHDEKPYQCSFCQYKTKYSTALHRHRFTQHKNEVKELGETSREFKCGSCDFIAFLQCELKQHEQKHLRKLRCKKCNYKAATEEELCHHYLIRHNIPYSINKTLNMKPIQIKPLKIKPSSVKKEISATSQGNASSNVAIFKCKICEHESTTHVAFAEHTKSHGKVDPRKCNLCGYETACQTTFLKHMRKKHRVSEDDSSNEGIMCDVQAISMGSIQSSRGPRGDSKGSISESERSEPIQLRSRKAPSTKSPSSSGTYIM